MKTAIIGGSGLNKFPEINMIDEIFPDTPWGKPSAPIEIGILNKTKIIFLPRHGEDNRIAPHKINYKANIWALHEINVRKVILMQRNMQKLTSSFPLARLELHT